MGNVREEIWVLLVDDSEDELGLVREYLRQRGNGAFGFDGAKTPAEAHEYLLKHPYDVILLDYSLGRDTGLDMLDAMPDLTKSYPVILLTEYGHPDVDREALKRGVFDFLDKSELTPVLLERSLRYAVNNFRIQQSLRERTQQLESLFDAVFEGVLVHDGQHILEVNHSFLRLFGVEEHEVVGAALSSFFQERMLNVLTTMTEEDNAVEAHLYRPDGTQLVVTVRVREHSFLGKPCRLVAVRNITRRKQAEAELMRINAELEVRVAQRTEALERSNRDLARFAEIVAHDIQGPLRTVRHCMEKMLRYEESVRTHGDDPFAMLFVDRAIQTVHRVQEMVNGVLTYSRIDAERALDHRVDLNKVMQDVLVDYHRQIEEKNGYVTLATLPVVRGNPALLSSLLTNLLDNAVKYCNRNRLCIAISVEESEQEWCFSVSDNGIGFAREDAERIFTMFYRSGNSVSIRGSGIGLSSCRRIVQLHGGRMWALAEPEQGATFYFTLPKRRAHGALGEYYEEKAHENPLCRG